MTYALSLSLQEALYEALTESPEVAALVGGRVWDAPPHADAPEAQAGPYVTFGDEAVDAWGAVGLVGAVHELDLSVHTRGGGFSEGKRIGAAVSDAVIGRLPPLAEGRVATSEFLSARTRRLRDGWRRIDLRFRFRIEA